MATIEDLQAARAMIERMEQEARYLLAHLYAEPVWQYRDQLEEPGRSQIAELVSGVTLLEESLMKINSSKAKFDEGLSDARRREEEGQPITAQEEEIYAQAIEAVNQMAEGYNDFCPALRQVVSSLRTARGETPLTEVSTTFN